MGGHIAAHELPQHLRGRLVLRAADFEEALSQGAVYPDPKANVLFHAASVHNGYTEAKTQNQSVHGFRRQGHDMRARRSDRLAMAQITLA